MPLLTAKNRESFPSEPNRAQGKGLESDPKSTQLRGRVTVTTTTGILAALLSTASVFGQQPTPVPTTAQALTPAPTVGPLQFQDVVTVEGATKAQLYDAALRWFPTVFKSGKDVLQLQDKEAGLLVGTAIEPCPYSGGLLVGSLNGRLRYRVAIEVKDGRYRSTVDGFVHEVSAADRFAFGELTTDPKPPTGRGIGLAPWKRPEAWAEAKHKAALIADELARSLKARLATAATEKPW